MIIIIIEYLSRIYNPSVPSTVINGVLLTKKIKNLINKNKQKIYQKKICTRLKTTTNKEY